MSAEREPRRVDHLRAATAALCEADDRLSAARLDGDDAPELDVAGKLLNEVERNVNAVRRREVRTDPVDRAGDDQPGDAAP